MNENPGKRGGNSPLAGFFKMSANLFIWLAAVKEERLREVRGPRPHRRQRRYTPP
jgi:hypothetical protein